MTATMSKPKTKPKTKTSGASLPPVDLPPVPATVDEPDVPVERTWRITWDGRSWVEADLCVAHAAIVTMLSGNDDWTLLDPLRGPVTAAQILAAFLSIADKRDPLDIIGELGRLPAKTILQAISVD